MVLISDYASLTHFFLCCVVDMLTAWRQRNILFYWCSSKSIGAG